jgi:hypothetical protein
LIVADLAAGEVPGGEANTNDFPSTTGVQR